mmetsp:Transcript_4838/g.13452  ORF Transcript_4838/g.13452 Transcript_4838/m.13452 type:complete len:434 (-) Transcript_4838:262-1563(-)
MSRCNLPQSLRRRQCSGQHRRRRWLAPPLGASPAGGQDNAQRAALAEEDEQLHAPSARRQPERQRLRVRIKVLAFIAPPQSAGHAHGEIRRRFPVVGLTTLRRSNAVILAVQDVAFIDELGFFLLFLRSLALWLGHGLLRPLVHLPGPRRQLADHPVVLWVRLEPRAMCGHVREAPRMRRGGCPRARQPPFDLSLEALIREHRSQMPWQRLDIERIRVVLRRNSEPRRQLRLVLIIFVVSPQQRRGAEPVGEWVLRPYPAPSRRLRRCGVEENACARVHIRLAAVRLDLDHDVVFGRWLLGRRRDVDLALGSHQRQQLGAILDLGAQPAEVLGATSFWVGPRRSRATHPAVAARAKPIHRPPPRSCRQATLRVPKHRSGEEQHMRTHRCEEVETLKAALFDRHDVDPDPVHAVNALASGTVDEEGAEHLQLRG